MEGLPPSLGEPAEALLGCLAEIARKQQRGLQERSPKRWGDGGQEERHAARLVGTCMVLEGSTKQRSRADIERLHSLLVLWQRVVVQSRDSSSSPAHTLGRAAILFLLKHMAR